MDVLTNIAAATMAPDAAAPYGLIADAALLIADGRIAWVGPRADLPGSTARMVDGGGRLVTPGLIDCHTHLVFGGSRAREWEARLGGASYESIARAGGGILSTVRATRALDEAGLVAASLPRLDALIASGVTTVEIKSGYALEPAGELRLLRAARQLAELRPVDVRTTLLAAHAVPPEHGADAYIEIVCNEIVPAAAQAGLADAVDAFCETIAFTPDQTRRVFAAARAHGLPVKVHAEQLSNLGAAAMAAREFAALSADHLEYLDAAGIAAMAQAGTAAVLLPGAFYVLREKQAPPAAALRAAGVPMAVATDCNPGTSPLLSLPLAMNMACTLFGLTPEEAWRGATIHAARALGLADRGALALGLRADLALWDASHPAEIIYQLGGTSCHATVLAGRVPLDFAG